MKTARMMVLGAAAAGALASSAYAAVEREAQGEVQAVDASPEARSLTLRTPGGSQTVNVPAGDATLLDEQGQPTSLDALRPGDRVRLRYRADRVGAQEIDWVSDLQRTGPVAQPDQTRARPDVTPAP